MALSCQALALLRGRFLVPYFLLIMESDNLTHAFKLIKMNQYDLRLNIVAM